MVYNYYYYYCVFLCCSLGPSRQQIMEEFQAQAEGLGQAVTKIKNDCAVLLQGVFNLPEKETILQSTDALSRITPGVVAKLRMIAGEIVLSVCLCVCLF